MSPSPLPVDVLRALLELALEGVDCAAEQLEDGSVQLVLRVAPASSVAAPGAEPAGGMRSALLGDQG